MKYTILLALGLALALPLHAANKNNGGQAKQKPHAAKAFNKADKDGDGFLSKEEFLARAEMIFNRKDKNADGKLSPEELRSNKAKAANKAKAGKKGKRGHKNQGSAGQ